MDATKTKVKKAPSKERFLLNLIWQVRLQLRKDGHRLRKRGDELWIERNRRFSEGFWREGAQLQREGDQLWSEMVMKIYPDTKIRWLWIENKKDYACVLNPGGRFDP